MSALIEAIGKIEDASLKGTLLPLAQALVRESGARGQDLIDLKERIKTLESSAPDATYAEMHKTLTALNVNPKEIPKLLEKLKVSKTSDDELELMKTKLKDEELSKKDLASKLKVYENKERLSKLLPEVEPTIVDDKGKPVKILGEFLNRHTEGLVANLSDDPVVAKEQVKQSLTAALQEQVRIQVAFGYQGKPVPQIPGGANFNQPNGINLAEIQKVMKEQGPAAAFAARRMAEQAG